MKILALLLALMLVLSGCSLRETAAKIDRAEDVIEQKVEAAVKPSPTPHANVTQEQAVSIALTHAGLTAEAVTGLRAEYEIDDGKAHYDVTFRQDYLEYEYEVDAATGNILSFEKDN